jgi:hypothetical protein
MTSSNNDVEKAMTELADSSNLFMQAMDEIKEDEEKYWNSLSKEQQLCCFNSVIRRIHKGDVELQGSYRYVLYQVFGFGPEAYARAQMAGYLDIHNMITTPEQERKLLTEFAKHMGHNNEEIEEKIHSFFVRKYF